MSEEDDIPQGGLRFYHSSSPFVSPAARASLFLDGSAEQQRTHLVGPLFPGSPEGLDGPFLPTDASVPLAESPAFEMGTQHRLANTAFSPAPASQLPCGELSPCGSRHTQRVERTRALDDSQEHCRLQYLFGSLHCSQSKRGVSAGEQQTALPRLSFDLLDFNALLAERLGFGAADHSFRLKKDSGAEDCPTLTSSPSCGSGERLLGLAEKSIANGSPSQLPVKPTPRLETSPTPPALSDSHSASQAQSSCLQSVAEASPQSVSPSAPASCLACQCCSPFPLLPRSLPLRTSPSPARSSQSLLREAGLRALAPNVWLLPLPAIPGQQQTSQQPVEDAGARRDSSTEKAPVQERPQPSDVAQGQLATSVSPSSDFASHARQELLPRLEREEERAAARPSGRQAQKLLASPPPSSATELRGGCVSDCESGPTFEGPLFQTHRGRASSGREESGCRRQSLDFGRGQALEAALAASADCLRGAGDGESLWLKDLSIRDWDLVHRQEAADRVADFPKGEFAARAAAAGEALKKARQDDRPFFAWTPEEALASPQAECLTETRSKPSNARHCQLPPLRLARNSGESRATTAAEAAASFSSPQPPPSAGLSCAEAGKERPPTGSSMASLSVCRRCRCLRLGAGGSPEPVCEKDALGQSFHTQAESASTGDAESRKALSLKERSLEAWTELAEQNAFFGGLAAFQQRQLSHQQGLLRRQQALLESQQLRIRSQLRELQALRHLVRCGDGLEANSRRLDMRCLSDAGLPEAASVADSRRKALPEPQTFEPEIPQQQASSPSGPSRQSQKLLCEALFAKAAGKSRQRRRVRGGRVREARHSLTAPRNARAAGKRRDEKPRSAGGSLRGAAATPPSLSAEPHVEAFSTSSTWRDPGSCEELRPDLEEQLKLLQRRLCRQESEVRKALAVSRTSRDTALERPLSRPCL